MLYIGFFSTSHSKYISEHNYQCHEKHNFLKFEPETNNLTGQEFFSGKTIEEKELRIQEINKCHILKI